MACAYVLPRAIPVTGPFLLKAPPLWMWENRSITQTLVLTGSLAGRLPTAEPLLETTPPGLAKVLQEVTIIRP